MHGLPSAGMVSEVLVTAIIAERSAARREGSAGGVRLVACGQAWLDVPARGRALLPAHDGTTAVFMILGGIVGV